MNGEFPPPKKIPDSNSNSRESLNFFREQVEQHHSRFEASIPLIASENLVSRAAMDMFTTDLHNRYAEGLPGSRYYEGNEDYDPIESHTELSLIHI